MTREGREKKGKRRDAILRTQAQTVWSTAISTNYMYPLLLHYSTSISDPASPAPKT